MFGEEPNNNAEWLFDALTRPGSFLYGIGLSPLAIIYAVILAVVGVVIIVGWASAMVLTTIVPIAWISIFTMIEEGNVLNGAKLGVGIFALWIFSALIISWLLSND